MSQQNTNKAPKGDNLLTVHEVAERLGYSVSSIWRLENAGLIPAKVPLAGGRVAWFESHLLAWLDEKKSAAEKRYAEKRAVAEKRMVASAR
ncbi:MAG: AlpA family phage regulatory protein [Gammaproteobacteria bacterium]